MAFKPIHRLSLSEAEDQQSRLAAQVTLRPPFRAVADVRRVAVLTVHELARGKVKAAGALMDLASGRVLEKAQLSAAPDALFPFLPALTSFRHAPLLQALLARFSAAPDAVLIEGPGVAHRARFGTACHLGVLADLPTFGVERRSGHGEWEEPPPGVAGAHVFIKDGGEPIGLAVRPAPFRPPLFLSPGHKIDMLSAVDILMTLVENVGEDVFGQVRSPRRAKKPARSRARKAGRRAAAKPAARRKVL